MNPAHQRGQPSTSSVRSFDETNEHATDYISGMYHDTSSDTPSSLSNHSHIPPPRKKGVPLRKIKTTPTSTSSSSWSNSSIQSTPSGSTYQRSVSSDNSSSPPERKSPTHTRARIRPPSPPPLSTQMPLSGLDDDDDGSSPSSPAEIAKELSNLQAFKRMSLDVNNQVSDPDLPSNRMSIPDFTELMEAGVDEDAARLLWVPGIIITDLFNGSSFTPGNFCKRRLERFCTTTR
jgi:hypothetical protein